VGLVAERRGAEWLDGRRGVDGGGGPLVAGVEGIVTVEPRRCFGAGGAFEIGPRTIACRECHGESGRCKGQRSGGSG